MRIDKFLKVSRILKRRTVAQEAADAGKISVNGKQVKPSYRLKVGDEVEAVVLTLDREERKMSLGIKQLTKDPWEDIETKYA